MKLSGTFPMSVKRAIDNHPSNKHVFYLNFLDIHVIYESNIAYKIKNNKFQAICSFGHCRGI